MHLVMHTVAANMKSVHQPCIRPKLMWKLHSWRWHEGEAHQSGIISYVSTCTKKCSCFRWLSSKIYTINSLCHLLEPERSGHRRNCRKDKNWGLVAEMCAANLKPHTQIWKKIGSHLRPVVGHARLERELLNHLLLLCVRHDTGAASYWRHSAATWSGTGYGRNGGALEGVLKWQQITLVLLIVNFLHQRLR